MSLISKAYHEAGHVVVGYHYTGWVVSLSLRECRAGRPGGHVVAQVGTEPDDDVDRKAVVSLAGPLAALMHDTGGTLSDFWLRECLEHERARNTSDFAAACLRAAPSLNRVALEAFLWRAAREALRILRHRWPAVEAVRKAAMRRAAKGRLTGDQIRDAIEAAKERAQNGHNQAPSALPGSPQVVEKIGGGVRT